MNNEMSVGIVGFTWWTGVGNMCTTTLVLAVYWSWVMYWQCCGIVEILKWCWCCGGEGVGRRQGGVN